MFPWQLPPAAFYANSSSSSQTKAVPGKRVRRPRINDHIKVRYGRCVRREHSSFPVFCFLFWPELHWKSWQEENQRQTLPAMFFYVAPEGLLPQLLQYCSPKWPKQCLCAIFPPRIVRKVAAKNGQNEKTFQFRPRCIQGEEKRIILRCSPYIAV